MNSTNTSTSSTPPFNSPTPEPLSQGNPFHKFLELRSQGHSLAKISQLIGVPKSTLYGWNLRNRETVDRLKHIEMEAIEERLRGSHQEQFAALSTMLDRLEKTFARKLNDYEDDLSLTELFWMAANLRQHVHQLRSYSTLIDLPNPHEPTDQAEILPGEDPRLPG